jgi:putative lipoic acid-binding regulatory protein
MSFDLGSSKPIIIYPCRWTYAVMGLNEGSMRAEIAAVVGRLEHEIHFSKRNGKFCSLHVKVVVESEDHRNEVFQKIQSQPSVRMII